MKNSMNLTRRQALGLAGASAGAAVMAGVAGCSGSAVADGSKKSSYKVGLILSGPANDGGWGQSHYESLKKACSERTNWLLIDPRVNASPTEAADQAQSYADQGVDLIVTAGTQFPSALLDVVTETAKKKPEVKFLFTNTSVEEDLGSYGSLDNVEVVLPDYAQLGQLAGVVAGLMTVTGKVGFVAGMELTSSKDKYEAYVAAAKKVSPSVEGFADYTAGYSEAAQGRTIASTMILRDGVDVIWGDASDADNGVRQALEDAGADSHFNIAQPIDAVGASQPTVIASTVIDWMVGQAMDRIESGEYGHGHVIEANMGNGGVSLGTISDKVPDDVRRKIEDAAEKIKNGSL